MKHFNTDLIFLQSENSREKLKTISGLLHRSPQRLKYTLKMMEKEGLLYSPHCVFDYSYFGLLLFRVYFKGGYISEQDKGAIIERLSQNPNVVSIYELSGEFDLAIEMVSKNPSMFNKELKNVADVIPTLNNYKVLLNIVTHVYPKRYLIKEIDELSILEPEIIVGGDREIQSFTADEMRLMRCLLHSPNKRMTRLAKEAGMNVKTAIHLISKLKERKIIRGFKYLVANSKLGISRFRLFLRLHNMSKDRDSQMLDYMKRTSEIVSANKTVGDWDMEIDIESAENSRTRTIIAELRQEYKDVIASFNLIEFTTFNRKNYLPAYLFESLETGINGVQVQQ